MPRHEYFADASAAEYTDARTAARACGGSNAWGGGWTNEFGSNCGGWRHRDRLRRPISWRGCARRAGRSAQCGRCAGVGSSRACGLLDRPDRHASELRPPRTGIGLFATGVRRGRNSAIARHVSRPAFFGLGLDRLESEVSRDIQTEIAGRWHARHVHTGTVEQRSSAAVATAAAPEQPRPMMTWDQVCLVLERDGPAAAEGHLEDFWPRRPVMAEPASTSGDIGSSRRNEGESLLRQVLEGDDDQWISAAGQILERHYRELGNEERCTVRARLDQFAADLTASQRERASVKAGDRFIAHGLNPAELEAITGLLSACRDLDAAWLVRKDLRHFRQCRLFVLVVRSPANWWGSSSEPRDSAIVRDLLPRIVLPGQSLIISPHGGFRSLARRIMKLSRARNCCWTRDKIVDYGHVHIDSRIYIIAKAAVFNLNRNRREGFSRRKPRREFGSRDMRGGGC